MPSIPLDAACGGCHHLIRTAINPQSLKPQHVCRRYPKQVTIHLLDAGSGQTAITTAQANPVEDLNGLACGEWVQRVGDIRVQK